MIKIWGENKSKCDLEQLKGWGPISVKGGMLHYFLSFIVGCRTSCATGDIFLKLIWNIIQYSKWSPSWRACWGSSHDLQVRLVVDWHKYIRKLKFTHSSINIFMDFPTEQYLNSSILYTWPQPVIRPHFLLTEACQFDGWREDLCFSCQVNGNGCHSTFWTYKSNEFQKACCGRLCAAPPSCGKLAYTDVIQNEWMLCKSHRKVGRKNIG